MLRDLFSLSVLGNPQVPDLFKVAVKYGMKLDLLLLWFLSLPVVGYVMSEPVNYTLELSWPERLNKLQRELEEVD